MTDSQSRAGRIVWFGVFELDTTTGELRKGGLLLSLQEQPRQVLTLLLERPGELVTREELRQRLWPADTFVDFEQGLNAAVKRLRYALGDSGDAAHFIETLPRRGYRWVGPVNGDGRADVPVAADLARPAGGVRAKAWMWPAALVVALGAGLALTWLRVAPLDRGPQPEPAPVPLTSLPGLEWEPALSPDGRRLAFCWDGDGEAGLYVKDVGGNDHVRLARGPAGMHSPAWSPDGRQIAFLRNFDPQHTEAHEIVVVPASGGPEHRLGRTTSEGHGLDWSPDGSFLAVVDKSSAGEPAAIFLMATATGERRRLTTPPPSSIEGDREPAFSPDGRSLAFVRNRAAIVGELYVQGLDAAEPRMLASRPNLRDVAWVGNGGSLVFADGRSDLEQLWLVEAGGGQPRRLSGGASAMSVSVARIGQRLAFEGRIRDVNVWRAPGPAAQQREAPRPLIRSTRTDWVAEYSPDGTAIAFVSTRSGRLSIWTCAQDGLECEEFKAPQRLAAPRWSPDGLRIAAQGWDHETNNIDVYVLEVPGRFVRRLTDDAALDGWPAWSADGRWLYFVSNRSGDFQLWKMASAGGEARQITKQGAGSAAESADGRWVYYSKRALFGSLWRVPAAGGDETLVVDERIGYWNWDLWSDRLVYLREEAGREPRIEMFDPQTRRTATLAFLGPTSRPGFGLSVSPDGRWVLYSQTDQIISDIFMVENFR